MQLQLTRVDFTPGHMRLKYGEPFTLWFSTRKGVISMYLTKSEGKRVFKDVVGEIASMKKRNDGRTIEFWLF